MKTLSPSIHPKLIPTATLRIRQRLSDLTASIRRANSAAFIHSCDPCPVGSTSVSTASLLVLLISIVSTFLDTLTNISSFGDAPEATNGPPRFTGKSA